MKGRRRFTLAYKSITQDIADCNTDIDRFLSEYAVDFFHKTCLAFSDHVNCLSYTI